MVDVVTPIDGKNNNKKKHHKPSYLNQQVKHRTIFYAYSSFFEKSKTFCRQLPG